MALVQKASISVNNYEPLSLPWTLDFSCPISLSIKSHSVVSSEIKWPYNVAGPSTIPDEDLYGYIRRRYYESIHLSDIFSPLDGFTQDLLRIKPSSSSSSLADLVRPLLLSLTEIEKKYRKTVLPLISTSGPGTKAGKQSESEMVLDEKELAVLRSALDLRAGSRRAVDDGVVLVPKKIADELERREVLVQIILLLLYISSPSLLLPVAEVDKNKKRKRSHKQQSKRRNDDEEAIPSPPADDPKIALDLLMDRLSVWQAIAELGLGLGLDDGQDSRNTKRDKGEDENPTASMLSRFWKDVIVPLLLPIEPDLCTILHLKIFGHPIPPKLLPVPQTTTKKPRKPKLTRARPSSDAYLQGLLAPPTISERELPPRSGSVSGSGTFVRASSSRAPSRASSDAGIGRLSPPRDSFSAGTSMRRSLSRTSDKESQTQAQSRSNSFSQLPYCRSRSRSIDPSAPLSAPHRPDPHPHQHHGGGSGSTSTNASMSGSGSYVKKAIMRAPSGKDLFKGREVGLLRRTTSKKVDGFNREDSQSQRLGLLGRKTSGGKEQSQSQTQTQRDESQRPDTLIMATPSKPRHHNHSQQYRPSNSSNNGSGNGNYWFPSPITEEPRQTQRERPTFIAETPVGNRTMKRDVAMDSGEDDSGSESDPLADLMVMTDDEDELDYEGGRGRSARDMVPETPAR